MSQKKKRKELEVKVKERFLDFAGTITEKALPGAEAILLIAVVLKDGRLELRRASEAFPTIDFPKTLKLISDDFWNMTKEANQ